MRSCFLRAVLLAATVVGIILVPALPAHAQCTHLGQQVVCPSGVSNGSTSLNFTNGDILWQTPNGSTTSSPRAGCCPPFTAPTPTAPTATGLTPTTGAGQNALSNAVRMGDIFQIQGSGFVPQEAVAMATLYPMPTVRTPSEAVASDRASLEAERQYRYEVYRRSQERAEAAEREASDAEREVERRLNNVQWAKGDFRDDLRERAAAERSGEIDQLLWEAAYAEHRAREAEDRGAGEEAVDWRLKARDARWKLRAIEHVSDAQVKIAEGDLARAQEKARAARERANAARRGAEETYRRLQEARREAEAGAERQPTERAQLELEEQLMPAQLEQSTFLFSDDARIHAIRRMSLRGFLGARPVINQSDAANARPPAPRSP